MRIAKRIIAVVLLAAYAISLMLGSAIAVMGPLVPTEINVDMSNILCGMDWQRRLERQEYLQNRADEDARRHFGDGMEPMW